MDQVYDVAIVGGGINGCGCAADAALRGLSVVLCEQDDLASKTSSSSSKLIHGGLRYLEYFDLSLVKKALTERQLLQNLAPHLISPLPIAIPLRNNIRSSWLIRVGLFIYDHLCRANTLPRSGLLRRQFDPRYFMLLHDDIQKAFLFYDCTTDDARLTIANALQAKEHGAAILTRTKLVQADVIDNQWRLTLQTHGGDTHQIWAKTVINAAGPWVDSVSNLLKTPSQYSLSLIKGSHLLVKKQYEGDHAYMLQHDDKRVVFVIPFHEHTLIGTTDVAFTGTGDEIHMDTNEMTYLLNLVNHYFKTTLCPTDVVHTWSGVRPLLSAKGVSPTALSRDYTWHFTKKPAPSITIYGGKITTYRILATQVINELQAVFPHLRPSQTATIPLPGSHLGTMDFTTYKQHAKIQYPWLDEATLKRYLNSYGTRTEIILAGCHSMIDLGRCFAPTGYQVEVDYLIKHEWAMSEEDILWRRTKLGLIIDKTNQRALSEYCDLMD